VFFVNEIGARFGMLSIDESIPDRQNPSTDPVLTFQHSHSRALSLQLHCSRQTRQTGSNHDDGLPTERSSHEISLAGAESSNQMAREQSDSMTFMRKGARTRMLFFLDVSQR
jgi:hypothetical protein